MAQRKVLAIFGTRPEAIKLAPVIRALSLRSSEFKAEVCFTAQHRAMADHVLSLFGIIPDYDLDVMTPGQTLAQITSRAVERLDAVMADARPDVLLVQGDTTTAMCGGLAGFYHRIPVGHVEAGLRTYNRHAPYPEEMNRRLLASLADLHFAPTPGARDALLAEGVAEATVFCTGNTVIDALLTVREQMRGEPPELDPDIVRASRGPAMVLVTGHRRESFGDGFENICRAIREVAERLPETVFVYPVHLNPSVREPVSRILGGHPRILLTEPLAYGPFVWLMDRAVVVLTDSGGVQEEAPSLGKPVLVMRETTERPEGVAAGNARVVGVSQSAIVDALSELLISPAARAAMMRVANPYGDGFASNRIADILSERVPGGSARDGQGLRVRAEGPPGMG